VLPWTKLLAFLAKIELACILITLKYLVHYFKFRVTEFWHGSAIIKQTVAGEILEKRVYAAPRMDGFYIIDMPWVARRAPQTTSRYGTTG
jgi:hypothetical protein